MPEEQAFMILCKLMEHERYLLREMYKANFENLRMKLFQLKCLIEENLPDIYAHFLDLNIECHMFASQWFLTLFTAKFPLYLVFRVIDLFLYEVNFYLFIKLTKEFLLFSRVLMQYLVLL